MKLSEQNEHVQRLKRILEPFILRRLKTEVNLFFFFTGSIALYFTLLCSNWIGFSGFIS
jgi:SNF2 family DNA or RNA helicase